MKPLRKLGRLRRMKRNLYALYLAMQDPRVPRLPKLVIGLVVAYALSPFDLIPDFIPVLGWLDDLVILPAGIWLAVRLLPEQVWEDCLARAARGGRKLKRSLLAAIVIVLIWIGAVVLAGFWFFQDRSAEMPADTQTPAAAGGVAGAKSSDEAGAPSSGGDAGNGQFRARRLGQVNSGKVLELGTVIGAGQRAEQGSRVTDPREWPASAGQEVDQFASANLDHGIVAGKNWNAVFTPFNEPV